MAEEDGNGAHEEVVNTLLDLQARLRGEQDPEHPDPARPTVQASSDEPPPPPVPVEGQPPPPVPVAEPPEPVVVPERRSVADLWVFAPSSHRATPPPEAEGEESAVLVEAEEEAPVILPDAEMRDEPVMIPDAAMQEEPVVVPDTELHEEIPIPSEIEPSDEPIAMADPEIAPADEAEEPAAPGESDLDAQEGIPLAVEEGGIEVLHTPDAQTAEAREDFAPVTQLPVAGITDDRIASLASRVANLEDEVWEMVSQVEQGGEDAVAHRLEELEQRMMREIGTQRTQMLRAIEEGFGRIHAHLRGAMRDVARSSIVGPERTPPASDVPEPDQPA